MLQKLTLSLLLFSATSLVLGQAIPTASRNGGLQVGAGYIRAQPDYSPHNFNGYGVYGDVDLWNYFGFEAEGHRIAYSQTDKLAETTFEVGGRFRYPIWRFSPYIKVMGGRGWFSFNNSPQNGSYAMYAGGGGIDYRLQRRISLRIDYEYQRWGSFPPRGLQPSLGTIGASYRFR